MIKFVNADQQPPAADTDPVLNIVTAHTGPDRKMQRLRKKILPTERARYERLTEAGYFFEAGASAPLKLSIPHARNFGVMFKFETQLP